MNTRNPSRRFFGRRDGTTVLEVAIILPVFLTFLFGLIEVGRVQMVANILKNACRQGARYGATEGVSSTEAVARVRQILGSAMDANAAEIIAKDASVFDTGDTLPESPEDYLSLPDIELDDAEPRQLYVIRATIHYEDIALVPLPYFADMQLTGLAFMRHE